MTAPSRPTARPAVPPAPPAWATAPDAAPPRLSGWAQAVGWAAMVVLVPAPAWSCLCRTRGMMIAWGVVWGLLAAVIGLGMRLSAAPVLASPDLMQVPDLADAVRTVVAIADASAFAILGLYVAGLTAGAAWRARDTRRSATFWAGTVALSAVVVWVVGAAFSGSDGGAAMTRLLSVMAGGRL